MKVFIFQEVTIVLFILRTIATQACGAGFVPVIGGPGDSLGLCRPTCNWSLVAHMSNSFGKYYSGMFDGDTDLRSDASYGTFVETPAPGTPDFQRHFTYALVIQPKQIKFETGNGYFSAIFDYSEFRRIVDERAGQTSPNIEAQVVCGRVRKSDCSSGLKKVNIFSKQYSSGFAPQEHPLIDIGNNGHCTSNCQYIIWGEDNFYGFGYGTEYQSLKNQNGGVNVYVRFDHPSDFDGFGC